MSLNRDLVSGAIIRTDILREIDSNSEEDNKINYGRAFNVNPMEIEEIMKAIRITCEEFDFPVTRIYISGFGLVSKDDLWSKEKIVDYFKNDLAAIRQYELQKDNNEYTKKVR